VTAERAPGCGLRGDRAGVHRWHIYRARDSPATILDAGDRLAISLNLAVSAALVGAGAWHAASARRQHRDRGLG